MVIPLGFSPWISAWSLRQLSFHMHSTDIKIALLCPTLKNHKTKHRSQVLCCAISPTLGKNGINLVLQMSVIFCDALTIERHSAITGMIMLWKRQAEGAPVACCVSLKMH